MIFIMTPESIASDNCRVEWGRALREEKSLFPILFLDCNLPLQLEDRQYIDFREDEVAFEEAFDRLLRELRHGDIQTAPPPTPGGPARSTSTNRIPMPRGATRPGRRILRLGVVAFAVILALATLLVPLVLAPAMVEQNYNQGFAIIESIAAGQGGDIQEAQTYLESAVDWQALAIFSTDTAAAAARFTQLGEVYLLRGDTASARSAFEEAIILETGALPAIVSLADLYIDDEEHLQAISILDQADLLITERQSAPTSEPLPVPDEALPIYQYDILVIRARAFLNLGSYNNALVDLRAAERITQEIPDLFYTTVPDSNSSGHNTIRLRYLRAFVNMHRMQDDEQCLQSDLFAVHSDLTAVEALAVPRDSFHRLLREDARNVRNHLPTACDEIDVGDFSWPVKEFY